MSWQYTDETRAIVFQTTTVNGELVTESCLATRQDVLDFVEAGGVIADPIIDKAGILAAHRYAVQTGGTTINGVPFLTDPNSQVALMGAMILASANSGYTVDWKTPVGFVTLTAAQVIGAYNAGAAFIQKCFNTEATLTANLAQYNSTAAITAAFDAAMKG